MAKIGVNGKIIEYEPYCSNPNGHFQNIAKKHYNAQDLDYSYRETEKYAREYENVRKKLVEFKKQIAEDLKEVYQSRGLKTIDETLSNAKRGDDIKIEYDRDVSIDLEEVIRAYLERTKYPKSSAFEEIKNIKEEVLSSEIKEKNYLYWM